MQQQFYKSLFHAAQGPGFFHFEAYLPLEQWLPNFIMCQNQQESQFPQVLS